MKSKLCEHRHPWKMFFLLGIMFFSSQLVHAQLTVLMKKGTLGKVINVVKSQSDYRFFYDDKLASIEIGPVNLKKVTIDDLLQTILSGKDVEYSIKDKVVYLSLSKKDNTVRRKTVNKQIKGCVKDNKGESLIGVSVSIKGTTIGTITDLDGNYSLTVPSDDSELIFSYIGYRSHTRKVGQNTVLDIILQEDTKVLDEVVVTAMGIKRSQKALSYNVQQVNNDELTRNRDANFINALSGKVAGVTINSSSSGIGGASKVVMRGAKAIEQSSNALYVIDGVPMFNLDGEGGKEFSSQGSTEAIADINPDDIESMSVLTGAAAAALYGSSAANGAIVITTKKGKAGRTELTINQSTEFLKPFVLPKFQNRYGTGTSLSDVATLDKSWGKLTNSSNYMGYSPKKQYFRTGMIATESMTLSTGSEKNQSFISASAVNSVGIIPNNKYNRYNFNFRNTASFLNDKMILDAGISYIKQNDKNMVNQGTYSNPLVSAYLFPRGDDWDDIRMYERYDTQRKIYTQYWPQGLNEFTGQNPYWINYRNIRQNHKDRYMLNASLTYKIFDWLNISGRIRVDNSSSEYEEKLYASSNTTLTEGSNNGFYGVSKTKDKQTYGDLMINVNKTFDDTYSIQANFGASFSDIQQDVLKNEGPLREDLFSNKFNVYQLDNTKARRIQSGYHDVNKSLFGSVELGYKSAYFLTLTGRNDWPSQLAGPNSRKTSFFYPSIGTSFVLSQIFNLPEEISFLKVRGSFASVGLPFPRFLANPTYEWDKNLQQWKTKSNYPMYNLKPEKTNSWELGIMARFLKHFNVDITLYTTNTYNQTFNPNISVSSAYSSLYVQTGSVRNQGIELTLGYKNQWGDFSWATNYTLSANKNKITELVRDYVHPETGAVINLNRLDVGGLSQAHFILKEGGTLGDLYSLSDLQRDSEGKIYIDKDGNINTDNKVEEIKLGSVFPKSNMAWRNDLSWKGFNLGFMLSARFGGIVYSATQAALDLYGVSEVTAKSRDNGYVLVNGNDYVNPEIWYTAIGSKSGIPQYYTYSATNIRLQEASLAYTFKKTQLWNVADLTVSLVGRNLFMIYCKAPFDPEAVATTGNYYQGIDNFMTPNTRNIGFNVKLKF